MAPDPPPRAPAVGTVLADRYELTRHIARGGMGDVYEATDHVLQRSVAVKLFRAQQPTDRARFDAEVRLLAGLSHPGLVQVFDAGSTGDDAFLVLELIDGPPLRARMDGTPMAPERVADIGAQVAEALAHIHAAGVVHRDVTPSNVLCAGDGRAKLVDFGIARLLDTPRVTGPELTVGTAAYMAPEQVQGHEVTPAADIYSLGLVLLEALTGQRAFPGTALESSVARLVRSPDTRTHVPASWQPLLRRMTATDPTQRPLAFEVRARLLLLGAGASGSATAPAVVPALPVERAFAGAGRRRHRPVWAVAAALAAAVTTVVVVSAAAGPDAVVPPASSDTSSTSEAPADGGGDGGRAALRASDGDDPAPEADATTEDPEAPSTTAAPPTSSFGTLPAPRAPTTTAAPATTVAPTTTAPATTVPAPTTTSPPSGATP